MVARSPPRSHPLVGGFAALDLRNAWCDPDDVRPEVWGCHVYVHGQAHGEPHFRRRVSDRDRHRERALSQRWGNACGRDRPETENENGRASDHIPLHANGR
jgi:hypothetical protein